MPAMISGGTSRPLWPPTAPIPPGSPPTTPTHPGAPKPPSAGSPAGPGPSTTKPTAQPSQPTTSTATSTDSALGPASDAGQGDPPTGLQGFAEATPRFSSGAERISPTALGAEQTPAENSGAVGPSRGSALGQPSSNSNSSSTNLTPGASAALLLAAFALFAVFLLRRLSSIALHLSSLSYAPVRPPS